MDLIFVGKHVPTIRPRSGSTVQFKRKVSSVFILYILYRSGFTCTLYFGSESNQQITFWKMLYELYRQSSNVLTTSFKAGQTIKIRRLLYLIAMLVKMVTL